MKIIIQRLQRSALALAAGVLTAAVCTAQAAYPERPIRLVVPYGPGGTGDVIARVLAQKMGDSLGQTVIVENRAGAAGSIGALNVARAEADGYTLLLAYTSEMVINPQVQKGINYSVDQDFAPIALAGSTPLLMVASRNTGVQNLDELIQLAKSRPGELSYASAGPGSPAHIAGALLAREAGIEMLHIPYKGGGQAVADTAAGVTNVYFSGMPPAMPLLRDGRLVALGVASGEVSPALPSAPALANRYPELDLSGWFGVFSPKGVPPAILERLHREIDAVLQSEEVKRQLAAQGVQTGAMSSAAFAGFVQQEKEKYAALIQALGINDNN
ncbi:Bug family tripartite tricarboxylate transporter substrate binding protein [Bordetella trematum]|uniref:Bug family tripartite tricarboxylate transporter substrate binding protein n=1 Tax=Bordetella trematum TaxID=123899 RepID=UPI000D9A4601|nr:tripartite tricarboxylate transporter substrate binding protein [Bordetella trematum]SPU51587.1 putattive exported protein [Bordetella trematum]VDH08486.1 Argininosuccinate lyase [Bordetella trematum]